MGGWRSSENIQRHYEVQHELRFISTQYTHYQSVDDILQLLQDVWSTKYKMLNQVYTMNFRRTFIGKSDNCFPLLEIFCIVISGWKNTSALRSIKYRDIIFTKHKNNNNKKRSINKSIIYHINVIAMWRLCFLFSFLFFLNSFNCSWYYKPLHI